MKITGKLFKVNSVNANGNYISREIAEKSIEDYKKSKYQVFKDSCGYLCIYDNKYGEVPISNIIGKVTRLEIVGDYGEYDAELIDTRDGEALKILLRNGAQFRTAVNALFEDDYNYTAEYKSDENKLDETHCEECCESDENLDIIEQDDYNYTAEYKSDENKLDETHCEECCESDENLDIIEQDDIKVLTGSEVTYVCSVKRMDIKCLCVAYIENHTNLNTDEYIIKILED